MNPDDWDSRRQATLWLSVPLGGIVSVLIGFLLTHQKYQDLGDWLHARSDSGWGWWAIFGAFLGGAGVYLYQINSVPAAPAEATKASSDEQQQQLSAGQLVLRLVLGIIAVAVGGAIFHAAFR
jgi:hypothetical protein